MAKKLSYSDIAEKDILNPLIKQITLVEEKLNKMASSAKSAIDVFSKEAKETPLTSYQNIEKKTKAIEGVKQKSVELIAIEKEQIELDKQKKQLQEQLNKNTDEEIKGKIRLQQATKAQKDALRDELILQDKNAGTLEKVAASNRKLRREREGLNLETDKGRKRLLEINAEIDKNNKKVLENSDKLKQQKLNVGNYTQSVKEGIQASGLFSRELAILTQIQGTLNAFLRRNTAETEANAVAQKTAQTASGGFTKALKVLKIALISTGIGAIVVALGALITAFSTTQRGADALSKVMRPLSVTFQRFIGFIQDTGFEIFDRLKKAFEDPKQAVIDLGDAIKENLTNRFKALGVFGQAIAKLFKGEFKEGFIELGDATVQFTTGITDASKKIQEVAKETKGFIDESVRQGLLLDEMIKKFERREIELTVPIAKARLEFEEMREIAQDQLNTDNERIKALNNAEKIMHFIADSEIELLDMRIKQMEFEQSFNDTSRAEELELQKLKAERYERDQKAQKKINSVIAQRSSIEKRQEAERRKAIADTIKLMDDFNVRFLDDEGAKKELMVMQKFEQEVLNINNNLILSQEEKNYIIVNLEKKLAKDLEKINDDRLKKQREQKEKELNDLIKAKQRELKEVELNARKAGKKEEEIQKELLDKKKELLEEEIKLRKEAGQDTIDLELELARLRNNNLEKEEKKKEDIYKKGVEVFREYLKKINERKMNAIDEEVDATESRIQKLEELANKGVQNADNALATAEKRRAELEAKRQRELQKQKREELALTAIEVYGNKVQAGEPNALASTITDIQILKQFISNLPAFYEGSEMVGKDLEPFMSGKDGHLIRVDGKERILSPSQNAMIPQGMSNLELAMLAKSSRDTQKPTYNDMYMLNFGRKLEDIEEAILNKPVYMGKDYDKVTQSIIDRIQYKNKKENNIRKNNRGIWGS